MQDNHHERRFATLAKRPGTMLLVLVLFLAGIGLGWAVFVRPDSEDGHSGAPATPSGTTDTTQSPSSPDTTATSSIATSATAQQVMDDVKAVGQKPPAPQVQPPSVDTSSYLAGSFGPAIFPAKLGAFSRTGSPAASESTLTADYRGPQGGSVDVLRIVVARSASSDSAKVVAVQALAYYPAARVSFALGSRTIQQGITQEDRPLDYPPALAFTWTDERYAISVIAIPAAPAMATAARADALELIAALPF